MDSFTSTTSIPSTTTAFLAKLLQTEDPENIATRNFRIFIGVLGCFLAILFCCFNCAIKEKGKGWWGCNIVVSLYFQIIFFLLNVYIMTSSMPMVFVGFIWLVFFVMPVLSFIWFYCMKYFKKRAQSPASNV